MSCQPTTRAPEDPYAFTESAPLQANSLAYANHSSSVNSSSGVSSNNVTTATTTPAVSSGSSLLLTPSGTGTGSAPKDRHVIVASSASTPATLKVRYNEVVTTTTSPTATTVLKIPATTATTVTTTVPVFTKPLQLKQQPTQATPLQGQTQPTVTVGKLIKKVLPPQKTPMITTVVAGGAKIISRLQQQNPSSPGQQLQPVLSTAGGSILKFIKIPPNQLAKGTAAGGTLPQGSFIQVTTTADGARKLVTTSGTTTGVNPTVSVTTGATRVVGTATATTGIRNATGVTVVPALPTVAPTKIRLIHPQSQGKIFLHTSNSAGLTGGATQISNPISIAALRNSLVKQQQQQLQAAQQKSQTPQQQASAVVKTQQVTPQSLQQIQQLQSLQKQILLQTTQQQPVQKQLSPQQPKQSLQQPLLVQKTPQQSAPQVLPKGTLQQVPQQLLPKTLVQQVAPKGQSSPQHAPLRKPENVDGTQKLVKPGPPVVAQQLPQSQPVQVVQKAIIQQGGQKQSLLLQHQQPSALQVKQLLSAGVQAPAKVLPQQTQSLLLQAQRKQQPTLAALGNKQRLIQQLQQLQKSVASPLPVPMLGTSPITVPPTNGSLLVKAGDTSGLTTTATKQSILNGVRQALIEGVRRSSNQQSLLVLASGEGAPKPSLLRDPVPVMNSVSNALLGTIVSKNVPVVVKKETLDVTPSAVESKCGDKVLTPQAIQTPAQTPPPMQLNANGKVRQTPGRKVGVAGKTGKQQKSMKRSYSQVSSEDQEAPSEECASPISDTPTGSPSSPIAASPIAASPIGTSLATADDSPGLTSLPAIKLEQDCENSQEDCVSDAKPPRMNNVASSPPGAVAVPIKRPKIKEWHAPGSYMFDLKDPGDESDEDAYEEYPNTLSFWYEESIAITTPDSTASWGMHPMKPRGPSTSYGGGRGARTKRSGRAHNPKFQIRMLTRDERLELKKAYLQRRAVQCQNGLRARNIAVSNAKRRLESMATLITKLEKRRQKAQEQESEKSKCIHQDCAKPALLLASHCYDHIMENKEQRLFQRCTAKFSDNSQCRVPVFDISHELVLCKEHAWKHDNHDKMSQEVKLQKKPSPSTPTAPTTSGVATDTTTSTTAMDAGRKKLKSVLPAVLVRSQKRPKKKKKLTPLQQQILLHQQQYQQRFIIHNHANQSNLQQPRPAVSASVQHRILQKKVVTPLIQQPQKSLLHSSQTNGKVPEQFKPITLLSKALPTSAQPGQRVTVQLTNGTKSSPKIRLISAGALPIAAQGNRNLQTLPINANNPRSIVSISGSAINRVQHNKVMQIVNQMQIQQAKVNKQPPAPEQNQPKPKDQPPQPQPEQEKQQESQHESKSKPETPDQSSTTQDVLTISENSSAYASSEDTGVGGSSDAEIMTSQDVIEEIVPYEFSNMIHSNMINHPPQGALNDMVFVGDAPAEDDTADSRESCPPEVEDEIEIDRSTERVKPADDMAVESTDVVVGEFMDTVVDGEIVDGTEVCTAEQIVQPPNKPGDIRGMVHT